MAETDKDKQIRELLAENKRMNLRLQEAEQTLEAIRNGQVDAVVVSGPLGDKIYTLEGPNRAYRTLFENMNEGAAIVGLDGTIFFCNSRLAKMLRIPMERLLGTSMSHFIHPQDVSLFESVLELGSTSDPNTELLLKAEDGTVVPVLISANPFFMEGPNTVCIFMMDLTKRKQAEQALKQTLADLTRSNRDLEHFAYVASHDLQEPLRTVTGALEMLERQNEGKLDERSELLIHYAVDGATKMKALVQDLLTYSRLTTGRQSLEDINVQDILDESIKNLRNLIDEKGTEITYDEMPLVQGNPTQLLQVFQNLLQNAVKFGTAESPRVHVSAEKNGNEWVFSVRDNGIGIPVQHFDRIFVIFQQLSKKGPFHGTGIGLAIVKKVIEGHMGRVWVESEVGVGSTFYFTIPQGSPS